MSFNFDELLIKGKEAADNVTKNKSEVQAVLTDLNTSLSNFLSLDISIEERIEYELEDSTNTLLMASRMFQPRTKTGYNRLYIKSNDVNVEKVLFKIKKDDDIYPLTVVERKNHYVSDNQDEFAASLGEVVTNSQVHLMLKSFVREVITEKAKLTDKE